MGQVTYTDWDKECELLKEWLKYRIEYEHRLRICMDMYMDYVKLGYVIVKERGVGRPKIPLFDFEQWKAYRLWDEDPRVFYNRFLIPSYMPEMTEEEYKKLDGIMILQPRRNAKTSAREPWPLPLPVPRNIIFKH